MIKIKVKFDNGIRFAEADTTSVDEAMKAAQARYLRALEFSVVSIVAKVSSEKEDIGKYLGRIKYKDKLTENYAKQLHD